MSRFLINIKELKLGDTVILGVYHESDYIIDLEDIEYYKKKGVAIPRFKFKAIAKEHVLSDEDILTVKPFNRLLVVFEENILDELIGHLIPLTPTRIENIKADTAYYKEIGERDYEWLGDLTDYRSKFIKWIRPEEVLDFYSRKLAPEKDGCNCRICKNFFFMAAPDNQGDGKLTCFSCRSNPLRSFY
jgi:hypothetical protein